MNKQEYKRKNELWLEEKATEEGVNELPRGILYKVLKSGDPNGKTPNLSNVIVAHYTGRTINGKQFDNSYSGAPLAIRLRELIEGRRKKNARVCIRNKVRTDGRRIETSGRIEFMPWPMAGADKACARSCGFF